MGAETRDGHCPARNRLGSRQPRRFVSLVGAKSPEQVLHNAKAADWQLTPADLDEIETIMDGFRMSWIKDEA